MSETGTYLPPVEMLQLLSDLYGLTINELLAGQRLNAEEVPAKAEENLTELMQENAAFRLNEQKEYWLNKWLRDHRWTMILLIVLFSGTQLAGLLLDLDMLNACSALVTLCAAVFLRNARDNYVEHHLYDEKIPQD